MQALMEASEAANSVMRASEMVPSEMSRMATSEEMLKIVATRRVKVM